MARQREYQGDVTANIRGGYTPFLLKRDSHLDIYQNAVNAINEQHEKALEARGKVESSIDQMDLAPEEAVWKQGFKEDILRQIDNEARYGGYSTALTKATKLAQTAATSPALLGRAKYYQQFKEWNKELDNRQGINQTTKAWARSLEQNKYHYKDTFDPNDPTKVVGGNDFIGYTRDPLDDIDWEKESLSVSRLLNPNRFDSESESSRYVDGTGGGSKTSSSLEKVSPEEVEAAMRKWYDSHKEQVYQDWEIFNWTIKQKEDQLKDSSLSAAQREAISQKLAEDKRIQERFGSDNLMDYANYQLAKFRNELSYTRQSTGKANDSRVNNDTSGTSGSSGASTAVGGYVPSTYSGGFGRVGIGNGVQLSTTPNIGIRIGIDASKALGVH